MAAIVGISGITGGYVGSTPVNALYLGADLVWSAQTSYTFVAAISGGSDAVITLSIDPANISTGAEITVRGYVQDSMFYDPQPSNQFNFLEVNPNEAASFGVARVSGDLKMFWFGGNDMVYYNAIPAADEEYIGWGLSKDGIFDKIHDTWLVTGTSLTSIYPSGTFDVYVDNFQWRDLQVRDNGVVLFNGVSAIRSSDGQGGLLDTVSNTFYTDPNHRIYTRQ